MTIHTNPPAPAATPGAGTAEDLTPVDVTFVSTGSKPNGPYSPGVVAMGRFVWVSGQSPQANDGELPDNIEDQTALTMAQIARVLGAAGASLGDVVRCGVFLADLADLPGMNRAFEAAFGDHRPTRTTVGACLAHGRVEIDCVAVVPSRPSAAGREA